MIFNTAWFLAFFAAFYGLLWLAPGRAARFWLVLVGSAVFHTHFAGSAGVLPIVVMAVLTFWIAFPLSRAHGAARKRWLSVGLLIPVVGLVYYKYAGFLARSLALVAPALDPWAQRPAIAMPLAISFFTFEFVHYLVDVYKGGEPVRAPQQFALFCIYFPSIVSGPIKRYQDFLAQVREGFPHPSRNPRAWEGLAQVMTGFFKKLVIADSAALMVSLMERKAGWGPGQVGALCLLLSARILFDFSGYSDIAIGLSKLLGLGLPENFNYPYAARNPSDFWRRWHMSLSSWIRDYIYIPLGGNRVAAWRRAVNALLAMALCGLWHGAAWNFAVWGLYHGAGLAVHAAWSKAFPPREGAGAWRGWGAQAANFAFVSYGWLLFFYPMDKVAFYTTRLLGLGG